MKEVCENEMALSEIVPLLLQWYQANCRPLPWREDREAYHVWVSEIMLQQTRVEAVIPYYRRFLQRCPDVVSLAACEEEELLKLWEGLGYYSRAKNLKKAAQMICMQYQCQFPSSYEAIKALPGIGEYTAGAIASIAFEQAAAAVDGNVLRVYTRLAQDRHDITDTTFRKFVSEQLRQIYPETGRGDFTQSLMELGAVVCVPNGMPKCGDCPVHTLCGAYRTHTQMQYPVKKKKAPRKVQEMTVLILRHKDTIALHKRGARGLLSGMWELPNTDGFKTAQEITQWLESQGIFVREIEEPQKIIKHIFTHVEWHMICKIVHCGHIAGNETYVWEMPDVINAKMALPAAFRKVYALMQC